MPALDLGYLKTASHPPRHAKDAPDREAGSVQHDGTTVGVLEEEVKASSGGTGGASSGVRKTPTSRATSDATAPEQPAKPKAAKPKAKTTKPKGRPAGRKSLKRKDDQKTVVRHFQFKAESRAELVRLRLAAELTGYSALQHFIEDAINEKLEAEGYDMVFRGPPRQGDDAEDY